VEDGLVDAQRLILPALTSKYRKSARVVSEAAKNGMFGDSFLYRLLVKMVQPWSTRYPLVEGQGNFGSFEGIRAAAMRYTECRSSRFLQFGRVDENVID
ncbi:unnamed protein product, partial [Hapterophycus canaliculatus]